MIGVFLYIGFIADLIAVISIRLFTASFGVLLIIYVLNRRRTPVLLRIEDSALPAVTIQLPIYNEASVVARLIDAGIQIEYPPQKLHLQILDDSTDHTSTIIQEWIAYWRAQYELYSDWRWCWF